MNAIPVSAVSALTLRHMEPRDLPHVLRIIERTPAPRWAQQDILFHFHSDDISSWVAIVDDQVAGFVVCRIVPALATTIPSDDEAVWRMDAGPQERFELLHLAVAPECQRNGIGRALVHRFESRLSHPGDSIRATVPESNLPMQLFLRAVGYKAVRVLRGYYGEEDAFVMEHRHN
jgi:ribosomal-protein-alanine N-acetyltransferase